MISNGLDAGSTRVHAHSSGIRSRDAISFEKRLLAKIYYQRPGLRYVAYLTLPFYA